MNSGSSMDTVLGNYIGWGKSLLRDLSGFSISCACRNVNLLAHVLARATRDFESPHCWVEPPSLIFGRLDKCTSYT